MTKTHCRTLGQRLYDDEDAHVSGCVSGATQPERERAMAKYSISYDGRCYEYNRYHYDRLSDAVAYARLMRSRPPQENPGGPFKHSQAVDAPTDADRKLMSSLAIAFEDGAFRFECFHYDRLADAVSYAKLEWQRRADAGGWSPAVKLSP